MGYNQWKNKYSKEFILLDAMKYSSRLEWQKNSRGAHKFALRHDLVNEACTHMDIIKRQFTKENVLEDAKKYNSKTEWHVKSCGAYEFAKRMSFFDEACAHMAKIRASNKEKELLKNIQIRYPSARTCRMAVNQPHIPAKNFEIDIFIPELNKGIEFDGTFHHSLRGLRRNRSHWTEEQLSNYHQIKDAFFKEQGISLLHINEKDWSMNKIECLEKAFEFLGE